VIPNPTVREEREDVTSSESNVPRSREATYLDVEDRFAFSDAWVARIRLQEQKKSETMPSAYYNVEPNWRSARVGPRPLQPRPYEEYVREKNKSNLDEKSPLLPPIHVRSKAATSSSSSKKNKSNSLSWSKKAKSDDDDGDKTSDTDEHDVHVELVSDL
jgi:hypothetical protein